MVVLFLPAVLVAEELSDTDVESIVILINGTVDGEIISLIEMDTCTVTVECSSYRNVHVTVRKASGHHTTFRASKFGDVWQMDEAERKRIVYFRNLIKKLRESNLKSFEDAA